MAKSRFVQSLSKHTLPLARISAVLLPSLRQESLKFSFLCFCVARPNRVTRSCQYVHLKSFFSSPSTYSHTPPRLCSMGFLQRDAETTVFFFLQRTLSRTGIVLDMQVTRKSVCIGTLLFSPMINQTVPQSKGTHKGFEPRCSIFRHGTRSPAFHLPLPYSDFVQSSCLLKRPLSTPT